MIMNACMPTHLYKILSVENWKKSQGARVLSLHSMDDEFIHLSTKEQLSRIIDKFWSDGTPYVVLEVNTAKLPGKLILESNPGGTTKYYHLYDGEIPLDAVQRE